jgi:hypothetical protein
MAYALTGTAVDDDHPERARLVAVTTTRRVEPTSAAETVYADVTAFGIARHVSAVVSVQRCH